MKNTMKEDKREVRIGKKAHRNFFRINVCYWFLHIANFEIISIIIHGYEF